MVEVWRSVRLQRRLWWTSDLPASLLPYQPVPVSGWQLYLPWFDLRQPPWLSRRLRWRCCSLQYDNKKTEPTFKGCSKDKSQTALVLVRFGFRSMFCVLAGDHRCDVNQFQCKNKQCIPVSWHCDGLKDCSDGSDEDAETCAQKTCRPGQFHCATGLCIPSSYVCDAQNDCGDNSDEPHETCSKHNS